MPQAELCAMDQRGICSFVNVTYVDSWVAFLAGYVQITNTGDPALNKKKYIFVLFICISWQLKKEIDMARDMLETV